MGGGVKVQVGIRPRYTRAAVHRPGAQYIRGELAQGHVAQDVPDRLQYQYPGLGSSFGLNDDDSSAPFGEEGFDISHEGGEYEVFSNVVQELAKVGIGQRIQRHDTRDRRDRTLKRVAAWAVQMRLLTDAYLHWRNGEAPPRVSEEFELSWNISCIDLFDRKTLTVYGSRDCPYVNVALVYNGTIGCAPHTPSICLTLRTLEEYHQGHRVNPRMSIQAQVRKMCALHNVPFHYYLVTQFSICYDIYLDILQHVDRRVNRALGRDSPDWRLLNSCPACEYRLQDEPPLPFSKFIAIDGNNSLRRVDPSQTKSTNSLPDSRSHTSDIWLMADQVDRFRHEVPARPKKPFKRPQNIPGDDDDTQMQENEEEINGSREGDVTDGAPEVTICIERWKAALPDERKKMWKMFVETGIFIAVCRHGFVLLLCDMVQSGELAKYPLALVDRLIDIYGRDLAIGYDIGCAFSKTILRSTMLAQKATIANLRMLVPSFHGHAHNRGCQLQWHPMYIQGAGLEDFETCERVFSQSNALASGTRHASAFHRIQAIEDYFHFWDEDKYTSIVQFICDNYYQALEILENEKPLLAVYSHTMGFTDTTYENFLQEERRYFGSLAQPRTIDPLDVQYVSLLQSFENSLSTYNHALQEWNSHNQILRGIRPTEHSNVLAQLSHNLLTTSKNRDSLYTHLCKLEKHMKIQEAHRWTIDHPRRVAVVQDISHRAYNEALDNLERLVVMCLFELTKLNQSGTAYKIRQQIQKHLQTRSRAIRVAIARYNKMASQLIPPREPLDIARVLNYAFIGEFELLRFARTDIRSQPWAQPGNREAMQRYFRIKAAQDEIARLNVEIRRVVMSIFDDSSSMPKKIASLSISNASLAHEIEYRWNLRRAINQSHMNTLLKLKKRYGFTGSLQPGTRIVQDPVNEGLHPHSTLPIIPEDEEPMRHEGDVMADMGEFSEDDEIIQLAYDVEDWHFDLE